MDFDDEDDIVLDTTSERDCVWFCINALVEEVIREPKSVRTIIEAILRMQFRLVAIRHPCPTTSVGAWPVPPPDDPSDGFGHKFLNARMQPLSPRRSALRKTVCDLASQMIYGSPNESPDAADVLSRMRSNAHTGDPPGHMPSPTL